MEIALALGGGGVKGIAHIGVLQSLEDAGFKIKAISGTSVGAVVGALYASGCSPKQIENTVRGADSSQMFKRTSQDGPSLMGLAGLTKILIEVLGDCTFDDLNIPFACTAVDTRTAKEVILHEGLVIESLLSSVAVPGVFPPRQMGDALLIDGGVLDPVPVGLARTLAPSLPIVAVVLNSPPEAWADQPKGFQWPNNTQIPNPIIEQLSKFRIGQALDIFLQSVDITDRMLAELRLQIDHPDVIIRPDVSKYGMLDRVNPADLVRIGKTAGDQSIAEINKVGSWSWQFLRRFRKVQSSFHIERSMP
jgi:NTE family protein